MKPMNRRRSLRAFRIGTKVSIVLAVAVAVCGWDRICAAAEGAEAIAALGGEAAQATTAFYDYDATIPLEARTVEKRERDGLIREKIVFRGVQGAMVPGYFEYAAGAREAMPCVLLLHGWSGSKESWWQDGNYISGGDVRRGLHAAGFAVFALDAQGHGDRISVNDYAPINHYRDPSDGEMPRKGYLTQEEIYIQTTRDYRRALDYLTTRREIESERVGVVGYSMGGTQTFLLMGVEPRLRAAVAVAAPAERSKWSPIAPQNFVRGIGERPFFLICGREDPMCSVEHAEAVYQLIDGGEKELEFFEGGHRLPVDYAARAVEWIRGKLEREAVQTGS